MANQSLFDAFERMWQHVIAKVGSKADLIHNHDDIYYTEDEVDSKLSNKSNDGHTHAITDVTNLQSSLDTKQATITGAATTIASSNLTANRALISNSNGKIAASAVTSTELGYLDGVTSAVQAQLDSKAASGHAHNYYGVCTTAAATAAKTVEIEGFELVVGAMVIVKFDNANSASNPTLNVSGTGAKPMYRYGTTAISTGTTTTGWYADSIQLFVYDGTGWIRDYWNNTTYSNVSLGQGYATCSTAEATVAKTATLSSYALTTGGIVAVKFTYAVPASATLNINSKGAKAIYHRGAAITAGVIKAGDIATFMYDGTQTQYHLLTVDRDENTTYSAAGTNLGLVKSGGDVTISSGVITVNDDSHNHVISNIDGLQSALDGKLSKSGTAAMATADGAGNVITFTYETKDIVENKILLAKLALEEEIAKKTQVQIITWEAND